MMRNSFDRYVRAYLRHQLVDPEHKGLAFASAGKLCLEGALGTKTYQRQKQVSCNQVCQYE